jgi:hypothetical protein
MNEHEMSQVNEYFVNDNILDQIEDTVNDHTLWYNDGGMDRTYITYTDQLHQKEDGWWIGNRRVELRHKVVVDVRNFDNFKE